MLVEFDIDAQATVLYAVPKKMPRKGETTTAVVALWSKIPFSQIPNDSLDRLQKVLVDDYLIQPNKDGTLYVAISGEISSAKDLLRVAQCLCGALLFTLGIKTMIVQMDTIEHVIKAVS